MGKRKDSNIQRVETLGWRGLMSTGLRHTKQWAKKIVCLAVYKEPFHNLERQNETSFSLRVKPLPDVITSFARVSAIL